MFVGVDLRYSYFANTTLLNVNFSGSDLSWAIFDNVTIVGRFTGAKLNNAKFTSTELRNADFSRAHLYDTVFISTPHQNEDFRSATKCGLRTPDQVINDPECGRKPPWAYMSFIPQCTNSSK